MKTPVMSPVMPAGWEGLKRFTDARIALGRAGHSQPTVAHLAFQLAHAQARDAVHLPLDTDALSAGLQVLGMEVLRLHSAAPDRASYLQRPDWGRQLDGASRATLASWACSREDDARFDLCFVIADGLSALAVMQSAAPLLQHLTERLRADAQPAWRLAPVTVVEQGRVAIGDEIAQGLRARCVVVLIGERPGLSSPDSLGVYFTWAPQPGTTDAQRNCVSNVRAAGLPVEQAAQRLHALLGEARRRGLSGVALKDETDMAHPAMEADATLRWLR
jgi:ethanolamine ammonia-lyase small subunit